MDVGAILKIISEKANLLFGVMLAGVFLYVLDSGGQIPETTRAWVVAAYWLAVVCGGALLFSIMASAAKKIQDWRKTRALAAARRAVVLQNFDHMIDLHRHVLVYLKANNLMAFSTGNNTDYLRDMAALGLLDVRSTPGSAVRTFTVPGAIWSKMTALGWPLQGMNQWAQAPWDHQRI